MIAPEAEPQDPRELLLSYGQRLDHDPDLRMRLAERYLHIRTRAGPSQRIKANAVQRAFEQRRGRNNIVLKARQMGLTTWIAGQFLLKTITRPGTLTVQVAHTREAAEGIFTMVQRMVAALPAEWREGPLKRSRSSTGRMVFGALDSEYRVLSAAADNAGRGWTIQNLHLSEVARWPGDAHEMLAGLRAALAPGGELVIESTPAGAYGAFYDEWGRAAETGTVRHFFPWWLEPAYVAAAPQAFTEDELALMRREGLSANQIGFRRGLERCFGRLRAEEYAEDPVSCFRASGDCCFELDAIEARLLSLTPPFKTARNGALLTWLPPIAGRAYVVAVDTAGGGSGGDYAAAQVIDQATGAQCAELREHLSPLELARETAALARLYNGAVVAVERNNHGAGVLAYLEVGERYPHLYEQHGLTGWLTTAASKPTAISRLGALLAGQPELFRSARLLRECRTYIHQPNGSTGAATGAHDDCLMAMAIGQAVRAERL